MTPSPVPDAPVAPPLKLSRGFPVLAWLALLKVSTLQFVRGRRLLALALLFLLPTGLAGLSHYLNPNYDRQRDDVERVLVFYMIPQALVPLTALVLASGMIRDEVEGQTLTYLLIRPVPRPAMYVAKLLAAWFVSAGLSAVFITTTLVAVHWGADDLWGAVLPGRAARVVALSALSLTVYVALFGGLSLVVRWVLPFGVAYIVMFEGVFSNIDFMVRRLTVLWYVRILAERWLGLHVDTWAINLDEAPTGTEALLTLSAAALVLAIAAAVVFGTRELRVKTPEGG
jgi:ABC-2 type transport system permease protein